jgi:GAF domain-containing protein
LKATIAIALEHITCPINLAEIYIFQITKYTLQGKHQEAIQAGCIALNNLGIEMVATDLTKSVDREFVSVASLVKNRSLDSLLDLPAPIEPTVQAAIKLLINLDPPTYISANFELYCSICLRAVRLSVEHGNIPDSVKAYANYGLLLCLREGQYQRGYEFANFAIKLSQKLNSKSQQCKAGLLLASWIQVWSQPIAGAANINYESFLAGMEVGEIQFAGYNLFGNIYNRLFQGENLTTVVEAIEGYWLVAKKVRDELLWGALAGAKIFIAELCTVQNQREANPAMTAAEKIIHRGAASQNKFSVCIYYILRIHLACLMEDFELGLNYIKKAGKILNSAIGFTTYSGYYYYGSLVLLNLYPGLSPTEQSDILSQVKSNQEQLGQWSASCPENFLHQYLLVAAESSRCLGDKSAAIDFYDRAINGALENGFIQEAALANELAAKFYLNWGKEKVAASYMESAYYCYCHWGAKAKIAHLEQKYPQLLKAILQAAPPEIASKNALTVHQAGNLISDSKYQDTWLDFAAVMKAAQAISEEIELEKLLATLMQTAIANAGAQIGHLILQQDAQWIVVASADRDGTQTQAIPLDRYAEIPKSLIYLVARDRETAVFDNLSASEQFAGDIYITTHQPKSVLCTPISKQGTTLGILYLENHLTAGAFSRDRVEILQPQSSIASESALRFPIQTASFLKAFKTEFSTHFLPPNPSVAVKVWDYLSAIQLSNNMEVL